MSNPVYRSAALSGAAVLCLTLFAAPKALACATCGCTLSADAAAGYSALTGWRLNLEMDYIDQNQLRSGTGSASPEQVVNHPSNPLLGGGEIEKITVNRYYTAGLSYTPTPDWNLNLLLPWIDRSHSTYGTQPTPYSTEESAPDQISSARVSSLGDIKFITSWQGLLPLHNLGLQLGLKLPTGDYGTHTHFYNGPNAGTPLDASLQAGTGSTDLIFGAYWYQAISQDFDVFINGQYQLAVAHKQDQPDNDFKPGNSLTASFGLRYEASTVVVPQLQVNFSHKSADEGALADTTDTAGTVVYLSPGATLRVANPLHVYAFVQVPVFSKLDGYQVFPNWTASVGLSYAF